MKHQFSLKCALCGQWKHEYCGLNGRIICDSCMKLSHGNVRIPLENPQQMTIDDYLQNNVEEIENFKN